MDAHAGDATAATRGHLLEGRYRLETLLGGREAATGRVETWRAVDVTLDRTVAVTLLSTSDDAVRDRVLAAAADAGTVADGRFVRVLDAGVADFAVPTVWVATEWVDGSTLTAVVARGEALPPPIATEIVRQCAEALGAAASAGQPHGALTPDRVLLPAGGAPRITGLCVAAALGGDGTDADDSRRLGGLLFAALTGRWPLPGWRGLPAVDARTAADPRPRAVRAGIPRDLDDVTRRALAGQYADPRWLARELGTLPSTPLDAVPAAEGPRRSDVIRRWAWRLVPPVVVVAVAVTGWEVGSDLGRLPQSARQHNAALPPSKQLGAGQAHVRLVWRRPPRITSFDPSGDGSENPGAVGLAVDRDPTTAWTTDTYRGDPHLGGLKPGVGLLIDLGRARKVSVIDLVLSAPGSDVELHAGDVAPAAAADLPVVAARHDASDRVHVTLDRPVSARYWLVWFTALPPAAGGYRVGVDEVALLG